MFVEPGAPYHRRHFHAYYQDAAAVLAIDPVECIGSLPRTQQRLVEAWAEIHREDLQRDWDSIYRVEHFEIVGPYTVAL